ncbi:fimbria/pilus periplasmic chaperone [Pseudomonas sp. WS 5411]|uniref:fimbria/pilus periplasmic chaperone n=1 Tax=Pseudomonas sp. WS 5411 TaxID=2717486 RepID=UPI001473AAF3|nr:fimbria/pilus periplasmic chaperone [Pseudomonas sp. WS 5411]NMY86933.1 fimbria/pilus periplasmic chaperone [Pseudomonas sp. WS 5411]
MNIQSNPLFRVAGGFLLSVLGLQQVQAAVALDRTRAVFNGGEKSISLSISNENKTLPYLAQGWVEDEQGNKITSPLTVLPPLQRLEPGAKSQIKVQALPAANLLVQDRETLFYFNLREIPPKSEKPNSLQLALQTRIKLFYRPKALGATMGMVPWEEQLTLSKQGNKYQVNNPTPYYVTIVDAGNKPGNSGAEGFEPIMVAPRGKEMLNLSVSALGPTPVLTYVNDYGGRPQLQFTCSGNDCKAKPVKPN